MVVSYEYQYVVVVVEEQPTAVGVSPNLSLATHYSLLQYYYSLVKLTASQLAVSPASPVRRFVAKPRDLYGPTHQLVAGGRWRRHGGIRTVLSCLGACYATTSHAYIWAHE